MVVDFVQKPTTSSSRTTLRSVRLSANIRSIPLLLLFDANPLRWALPRFLAKAVQTTFPKLN